MGRSIVSRLVVLAAGALLASTSVSAAQVEPPPAVAWVREHALPLASVEAGHGFDDLRPLAELIGDARIVALGEGTHGTHEFFTLKHRLLEFLATELGFTLFSIEASTPEAYALDPYVLGGKGDPAALVGGMYFWTWNTHEVLDMVEWMRAFNVGGKGPVHFTGFDMQTPDVAMDIVSGFLDEADPERVEDVRARQASWKKAQPRGSQGVSNGTFPVEEARGKRVRFSGWIRTQELEQGWAGLWWRNDLADGSVGGFDNMAARGPRGTSEWAEYALELDVPEETVNIDFGMLVCGRGEAWFDSLAIALDGEPRETQDFDLGFESGGRGFSQFAPGFRIEVADGAGKDGSKALTISSLPLDADAPDVQTAVKGAQELCAELEGGREAWVEKYGAARVDWVVHNARIVEQCLRSRDVGGYMVRDESMARNVGWILEQHPGARIVLWAHNGHVQRQPGAMGMHLAQRFGDDYVPIGFATDSGRYVARGNDRALGDHPLAPPPDDSVEHVLAAAGLEHVLDARARGCWARALRARPRSRRGGHACVGLAARAAPVPLDRRARAGAAVLPSRARGSIRSARLRARDDARATARHAAAQAVVAAANAARHTFLTARVARTLQGRREGRSKGAPAGEVIWPGEAREFRARASGESRNVPRKERMRPWGEKSIRCSRKRSSSRSPTRTPRSRARSSSTIRSRAARACSCSTRRSRWPARPSRSSTRA